jgi:nitric oxide reductase subunit B
MTEGALPEEVDRQALTAFFFWTSWAAATNRPDETDLSYTSNWPHEPLVGNTMSTSAAMWSMVSIILLLAGIAAMLWLHGSTKHEEEARAPKADPLFGAVPTPR